MPSHGCRTRTVPMILAATMLLSLAAVPAPTPGGGVHAAPPSWAPAHGYRAKHKHKAKTKTVYRAEQPTAVAIAVPEVDLGETLTVTCHRDLVGGVIGGILGGVVGSQFGKGSGKTAATIGGTLVGVLVGGAIGRDMDAADRRCTGQVLENAPDRQAVAWHNPDADADYTVVPINSFRDGDGRTCRNYQTRAVVEGRAQVVEGTACRQPDGAWRVM